MCVVCGDEIGNVAKKQRKVATFGFGVRLMEACFLRGYDQWAMEIKGRLESCIDLPAQEAVYHHACYSRFLNYRAKLVGGVPCGRPVKEKYLPHPSALNYSLVNSHIL